MLLAGLIDLGANFQKIKEKLSDVATFTSNVKDFMIDKRKVNKNGIKATQLLLNYKETKKHTHGKDLFSLITKISDEFKWNLKEKNLALNILNTLIQAEAKIHGTSPEQVHLHEAGSFDTIVDIIGFILACQDLNLLENCLWVSSPIAVGGGLLEFSHGIVSNPAPATLEILKGKDFEIIGGPVDSELATPTGVSILVNMVQKTTKFYPPIFVEDIGYGAGEKNFSHIANVLRIIKGKRLEPLSFNLEQIITIETNVDDITGELLGNTINKIMESGYVKDVSVIPITTKKRPGYIIQILTTYEYLSSVIHSLIHELGTLGVRFYPTMRYTLNRKIISIPISILDEVYTISVKISWDSNKIIVQTKPEADEILNLSKKTGLSMKKILQIINKELEKRFPIGHKIENNFK